MKQLTVLVLQAIWWSLSLASTAKAVTNGDSVNAQGGQLDDQDLDEKIPLDPSQQLMQAAYQQVPYQQQPYLQQQPYQAAYGPNQAYQQPAYDPRQIYTQQPVQQIPQQPYPVDRFLAAAAYAPTQGVAQGQVQAPSPTQGIVPPAQVTANLPGQDLATGVAPTDGGVDAGAIQGFSQPPAQIPTGQQGSLQQPAAPAIGQQGLSQAPMQAPAGQDGLSQLPAQVASEQQDVSSPVQAVSAKASPKVTVTIKPADPTAGSSSHLQHESKFSLCDIMPPPWNIICYIIEFIFFTWPMYYFWLGLIALAILYRIYLMFKEVIDPIIIIILDAIYLVVWCVVKTCQAIWAFIKMVSYPIKESFIRCYDSVDHHLNPYKHRRPHTHVPGFSY